MLRSKWSTFLTCGAGRRAQGKFGAAASKCKEDLDHIGAEDLHQLQRAWELQHRVWTSEAVLRHTLFRQETRWPGYYYRGDYPKLDDAAWHAFTSSRYDAKTGEWQMSKLPVHHIIA